MSSILKALRKLEEEKRGGKLNAPDLRVDQGRTESSGRPLVPLAIGTLLGMVLVGLIFLWSTGPQAKRDLSVSETGMPAASADSQVERSPQNVVQQPVVAAPENGSSDMSPPSHERKTAVAHTQAASEPVAPAMKSATDSTAAMQPASPERALAPSTMRQSPIVVQQALPSDAARLPDGITLIVSEIYYLDEANSMAVVNDLPVMVGSHVDSVVVSEIQADRVLFEIDGKVYPVSLLQP